MSSSQLNDYMDEDVAYLLGAIVARGEIDYNEGRITITYPYKYLILDNEPVPQNLAQYLVDVHDRFANLGFEVEFPRSQPEKLILTAKPTSLQIRLIKALLNFKTNYREFEVPSIIMQSEQSIVKEFLRGYADVAGHIRASNRDENGFHRVYLDVLFENWRLPVQLCNLIQYKIGNIVQTITWAHPNIRDPNLKHVNNPNWWKKEHQIKIYAHDFLKIGFYINHKQKLLEKYAQENLSKLKQGDKPRHKACNGNIKRGRQRQHHPGETDSDLPEAVKRHFDHFTQICKVMGCNYCSASKCLSSQDISSFLR